LGLLFSLITLVGLSFGILSWFFPSVVIDWNTESELDTIGFNVFRSESQDRNYTRLNNRTIPSSGDSLGGGQYSYTDTHVKAFRSYYYLLEEVSAKGTGARYGPRLVDRVGWVEIGLSGLLLASGASGLAVIFIRRKREACPGLS